MIRSDVFKKAHSISKKSNCDNYKIFFYLLLKKIHSKKVTLNSHEIKNNFRNMTYVCE